MRTRLQKPREKKRLGASFAGSKTFRRWRTVLHERPPGTKGFLHRSAGPKCPEKMLLNLSVPGPDEIRMLALHCRAVTFQAFSNPGNAKAQAAAADETRATGPFCVCGRPACHRHKTQTSRSGSLCHGNTQTRPSGNKQPGLLLNLRQVNYPCFAYVGLALKH